MRRGRSSLRAAVERVDAVRQVVTSRWLLRSCDAVGALSRVTSGRPVIENRGEMTLASRVHLHCGDGAVILRTARGGRLAIGSRSVVNHASIIEALESVEIGDRVSIAPHCIISDAASGSIDDPTGIPARPIVIEDGAWLASRVTVLPGSRVGAGTVVTAGSVVDGELPPGVLAGGIPARVLRRLTDAPEAGASGGDVSPAADEPGHGRDEPAPSHHAEPFARGIVLADFTVDPLADALRSAEPSLAAEIAPYGTVVPTLLEPPAEPADFAVVWTQPHLAVPAFARLAQLEPVTEDELVADVDRFVELARRGLSHYRCAVVPTWTVPPWQLRLGLSDLRPGGIAWGLAILNRRLADGFADSTNVYVLDASSWMAQAGAHSERLWYRGKVPFVDGVFAAAAADIAACAGAALTAPRKLLVLDLDDTLWGGIVGDVGWQELRLGGHDGVGEAYADFQRALRALGRRGVLLAVVSKNEEDVALAAIDQHPEMVLRRSDLVGWRINWFDKARNIAELASELNLGLQSVVFIDDNARERDRVRAALPEVLVPDWPDDPFRYAVALASLRCFDSPALSAEDARRGDLYAQESERKALLDAVGSFDEWLRELDVRVIVEPLGPHNAQRATQLLNKTNQLNARTRRLTQDEFLAWAAAPGNATVCITVSDRLGDAGLTGIASVTVRGGDATLEDYLLSCRVMGRRIEETLLSVATQVAADLGAERVVAHVEPTEKNAPCRRFFADVGLEAVGELTYSWAVADRLAPPADIHVEWRRALEQSTA